MATAAAPTSVPVPVTILTGFLGSGKTTLLNRILTERHGERIAIIENEFGEAGIDNEILLREEGEQIIEMNNGCICCTVRGDLVRILGELASRRASGALRFDRVVIETTGLADPAPVAQTFFVDEQIGRDYLLDAIVTLVDARHAPQQLDAHHEAQEQVGFADRILLSKTDLVDEAEVEALRRRLMRMNPRARIGRVDHGRTAVADLLDIRGFNLNAILEVEPAFLTDVEHEHDDDVTSFVYRQRQPMDLRRIEDFLGGMLQVYGPNLLRYKGVLNVAGEDRRIVFQGVHMLMGADNGPRWKAGETRESKIVFIGRDLPRDMLVGGLDLCVAPTRAGPPPQQTAAGA